MLQTIVYNAKDLLILRCFSNIAKDCLQC